MNWKLAKMEKSRVYFRPGRASVLWFHLGFGALGLGFRDQDI